MKNIFDTRIGDSPWFVRWPVLVFLFPFAFLTYIFIRVMLFIWSRDLILAMVNNFEEDDNTN